MKKYPHSIIQRDTERCFLCGRSGPLEVHHVFGGVANRPKSTEDGLVVHLCPDCHRNGPQAAHRSITTMQKLRAIGQKAYEQKSSRAAFMKRYGRNYL
ncbi:MAG: hypothetical protein O2V44_01045 [Candidatus Bathyarchaeota archaeon]|nr:hypothetical protein [Candidatus Bathyarchaeota archaeon]